MPLFNVTQVQNGTGLGDFMFGDPYGGADHRIFGNSGDDVIYGDADYFHIIHGTSAASAFNITDGTAFWSKYENAEIRNATTVPHTSLYVAPEAGTTVWYKVTVAAGATITLDVDFGYDPTIIGGDSLDVELRILADDGLTELAAAGGGFENPGDLRFQSGADPFLQHTFVAAGVYLIQVGSDFGNANFGPFAGGEEFLLNVSLTGQSTTGGNPISGDDILIGGVGNDHIDGGGGDDNIQGGEGYDTIIGGTGNDYLVGDLGNDDFYILGNGSGVDIIIGGDGEDTLDLSRMTQSVWVNLASTGDQVQTRDGTVWRRMADMTGVEDITGTSFHDQFYGDGLGNRISGGAGNDTIYGRAGADTLTCGDGNDSVYGEADGDLLIAGAGTDDLNGGTGDDSLTYTSIFDVGAGLDTLDGGTGTDLFYADVFTHMMWVDLQTSGVELYTKSGTAWVAVANVRNIENISATRFNDEIHGDAKNNEFYGWDGNDTLDGRGGVDTIHGGKGYDTLIGGDLADILDGGADNDTFVFGSNFTGVDIVEGGTGHDTVDCSAFITKAWVDLTFAGAEVYTFNGGWKAIANTNSIENVFGSAVADELYGNDTGNTLIGGGGNDIIQGRKYADVLTGGSGSDTFKFSAGDTSLNGMFASEIITDFAKGAVGVGDEIDYGVNLAVGGSAATATVNQARINAATGVATFAAGSGTHISDAVADVLASFTAGGDAAGEFAFFRVNNAGPVWMVISDGVAGTTGGNDVFLQLTGVTSVNSINITAGDVTILG